MADCFEEAASAIGVCDYEKRLIRLCDTVPSSATVMWIENGRDGYIVHSSPIEHPDISKRPMGARVPGD